MILDKTGRKLMGIVGVVSLAMMLGTSGCIWSLVPGSGEVRYFGDRVAFAAMEAGKPVFLVAKFIRGSRDLFLERGFYDFRFSGWIGKGADWSGVFRIHDRKHEKGVYLKALDDLIVVLSNDRRFNLSLQEDDIEVFLHSEKLLKDHVYQIGSGVAEVGVAAANLVCEGRELEGRLVVETVALDGKALLRKSPADFLEYSKYEWIALWDLRGNFWLVTYGEDLKGRKIHTAAFRKDDYGEVTGTDDIEVLWLETETDVPTGITTPTRWQIRSALRGWECTLDSLEGAVYYEQKGRGKQRGLEAYIGVQGELNVSGLTYDLFGVAAFDASSHLSGH